MARHTHAQKRAARRRAVLGIIAIPHQRRLPEVLRTHLWKYFEIDGVRVEKKALDTPEPDSNAIPSMFGMVMRRRDQLGHSEAPTNERYIDLYGWCQGAEAPVCVAQGRGKTMDAIHEAEERSRRNKEQERLQKEAALRKQQESVGAILTR